MPINSIAALNKIPVFILEDQIEVYDPKIIRRIDRDDVIDSSFVKIEVKALDLGDGRRSAGIQDGSA
jgi:hypothetical protein